MKKSSQKNDRMQRKSRHSDVVCKPNAIMMGSYLGWKKKVGKKEFK